MTIEQCLVIDAALWTRKGILREGLWHFGTCRWTSQTGEVREEISFQMDTMDVARSSVYLVYTMPQTGEKLDYIVRLQTTRPHWGGVRWWFICPFVTHGKPCGRRVQKLYRPLCCKYYGCRHCYGLAYLSQREDAETRVRAKAEKIRVRLGGSPSPQEPFPHKPKGMWWRTYERFREVAERVEMRSSLLFNENLARINAAARRRASRW